MTGKMMVISILLLWIFAVAVNPWDSALASAGDYTQDIKAVEHRISQVEMTIKELAGLVTKDAGGTLEFYQETEAALKRLSAMMDSLERRMSESERQRADFQALNSRASDLEVRIPGLENRWAPAKGREADTSPLRGRAEGGRRPPRSGPVLRVFIFDVASQGGRTEIRYYTVRDISVEDIRLPDYLVRGMERVGR